MVDHYAGSVREWQGGADGSVKTVGVGAERAEGDLGTSVQPKLSRRSLGSSSLLPRRQFLL